MIFSWFSPVSTGYILVTARFNGLVFISFFFFLVRFLPYFYFLFFSHIGVVCSIHECRCSTQLSLCSNNSRDWFLMCLNFLFLMVWFVFCNRVLFLCLFLYLFTYSCVIFYSGVLFFIPHCINICRYSSHDLFLMC